MAPQPPNLYELSCGDTHVTYSTSSFAGPPQLSYAGPKGERSFTGPEIDVKPSLIGTEVTVTLESVPDLHVLTLTVLLPDVRIEGGGEQALKTFAILTANFTSISGPPAVGQSYEILALEGVARVVEF